MTIKEDIMLLVGFLVLLFIGWIAAGGPEQARETGVADDKFVDPLDPFHETGTYDEPWWDPNKGVIQNPILR